MRRFLFLLVLALAPVFWAEGAPNRGLWFWGSTTLPGGAPSTHGSIDVVGDPLEELIAVSFMTTYGVKRVYGSYQNRPVSEPGTIADWNAELDAAGIESQLLIDGTAVHIPAEVADLQDKIAERLIDFNILFASNPAKQFDALHLDLEPQGTYVWDSDTTGTDKRALLDDLAAVFAAIRTQLDTAGFASIPIYADIPFFWDKLPADGGSVAWADTTDRNDWYADLADSLAGLSIMTFSKSTSAALQTATAFERGGTLPGEVVVGIQPKTGPGQLWADYA
ncbi:MAG: hypothetical protein HKO57_14580, partial [Akkermansiaceae bacterium]|nr:hypothetical protein [Akkermansiaceae bacterium]